MKASPYSPCPEQLPCSKRLAAAGALVAPAWCSAATARMLMTQLTARLPLLLAWSMRSMVLCSCVTRTSAGTLPPTPTSIRSPGTSSAANGGSV